VWRNELGGTTWAIGEPATTYAKWQPHPATPHSDLRAEAARLDWVGRWHPVPRVVDVLELDGGVLLVTEALDLRTAVDPTVQGDAAAMVEAIATGLRRLHDDVPVEACPYDWSVQARLAEKSAGGAAPGVLQELGPPPEVDLLVVCHGDACAPNTLVTADLRFGAHCDLARLGVADRWADLAVASWSLEWNVGAGFDRLFFDTYGVAADPERIDYYRRLWAAE
jgi:kanamycin kinase